MISHHVTVMYKLLIKNRLIRLCLLQGSTVNQNINQKMYDSLSFVPNSNLPQRLGVVLLVGKDCLSECTVCRTCNVCQLAEWRSGSVLGP